MHHFRPSPTNDTTKHRDGKERNCAISEREKEADERFKEKPKRPSMEELLEGI